jgi:hypothetical protein
VDAIENETTSLRKASRHWNTPLTSLSNHLYGNTRSKKLGPTCVLIIEEDRVMVGWVLSLHEVELSINIQQLKMKVAELTQTRPTPFRGRLLETSWWY